MNSLLIDPVSPIESLENESERIVIAAIASLAEGNDGAHWESPVLEAARRLYQNSMPLFQRLRSELKKASKEAQITEWTRVIKQQRSDYEDSSKSGELVEMCMNQATLFHDASGECHASFVQDGHEENWPLASKGFGEWLSYRAYQELGFVPPDTALRAALMTLRGIATHEGEECEVFLRCAPWKSGYIIDLTNDTWGTIAVSSTDWQLIDLPPVKFIRSQTARPLPIPRSGNLDLLWRYANIPVEARTLVLTFILDSWRPDTPYPMLSLCGEQGSGKSSTHEVIRQLSDPNAVPLRAAPKCVEDVFVSAGANHQASFENMSNLSAAMQDALCTLATGGGFAKRKLYSDADESVIEVKRPIIINGIADAVTRPDLIDRTVRIDVPSLKEISDEQEYLSGFERDKPEILGGLLDLFSSALAILPSIHLAKKPRMIGFARLGEAVHEVLKLPVSFAELYSSNRAESLARSLDSSPAAMAVKEMVDKEGSWEGTVKALKTHLDDRYHGETDGWPKSVKGLGDVLRRMASPLRSVGVVIEFLGRKRDGWHVHIFPSADICIPTKGHDVHTVTENQQDRDQVNVVNNELGKKKTSKEDIPSLYQEEKRYLI